MNWISCSLFVLLVSLAVVSVSGTSMGAVVINEAEIGPPDDATEWVELYNSGESEADIGRWDVWIVDSESPWTGIIKIPPETTIPAKGFYLVEGDERWVHENLIGVVTLKSWPEGDVVDKSHLLEDPSKNSFAWSRYPDGTDTNLKSDWYFTASTPGAENYVCAV